MPFSTNVSKHGVYFHTHVPHYRVGMRLFITYPYSMTNEPLKSEFLGDVVRVEKLADSPFGIAIRLLSSI
ncbi:MAG: hypothetical protein JO119_05150 [Acidobacteria bacterium]|nr:hypothetical protein [Acidobacteriota bacterium]